MSSSGKKENVLLPVEAEAFVGAIESIDVKEIGSSKWYRQHSHLEQLNMQAALNASAQEDEFVKDFLIEQDKVPVLIHDLLATEIWKQKVFPLFTEADLDHNLMFPLYTVLYHEATVANLLETILFYQEVCEASQDVVLDLIDYCYRKLSDLIARSQSQEPAEDLDQSDVLNAGANVSSLEELQKQNKTLSFDIGIKAVSIMRYITDHLSGLPLSASSRILNTLDVPVLMVQLVETPPWTRNNKGKIEKYMDNKWQEVSPMDRFKLTKLEGQVWIALFHLLMEEENQKKYELNSHRKNSILRLRASLNEMLVDQLPILGEMQRYLEQLSLMEPPAYKRDLVLEQVPEMRDRILQANKSKWRQIAEKQSKTFFNPDQTDMREQAKRLAETYNFDLLENLITEPPKCVLCGEPATNRCSRCQNEWYCRRECQVGHWKKHKKACDLVVDSNEKIKQQEQS